MAEAIVSEVVLSGLLDVVLPEAVNFIQGKKLDHELRERLQIALGAAKALLIEAEKKQFPDPSVKDWLNHLKDAVYTADDLLDHVLTKAATQDKEVSNFLPGFLKDRDIVTKVEEIVRIIKELEKRKYILGLKEIPKENLSWRTPSTSLVKGEIFGRENDKDAMIKLLKDENIEAKISVIPIVGMGGVGKTTLAQWLYNNEGLMKDFDLKAWVCVSEEFDIVKITQTIIEAVTSRPCDTKDLNLLQLDLKDKLIGKKFFIVLDDVWNGDWNNLETPFQYGVKGSKILITTRSEKVASVVQTCPLYLLNELSDEYCWSVFANHAYFAESTGNPTLEKVGRDIVKKCKGLPLAAQTLGGLLRVKHDVREWNTILTTEIWNFSVEDSKIVPALLISYYHLPPHSKSCFVYCSLYPKGYGFNKDELILLWMAADLLPPPNRGKTLEEVGYECFDDLACRLFFKQSSTSTKFFVMHDLMHDLATSVAGEFYFRSEELGNAHEMSTRKMSRRTRHLSYGRLSHPISKDSIGRVKSLRTLLPINFSNPPFSNGSTTSIILSELKWLRVLSFAYFRDLDALPDSIGDLIHLRYLDLSRTGIKTLPESLSNLYNLQTLKLCYCSSLTMLPNGMQNLVNLRHLDLDGTTLKEMPPGMSKLINLQHLDYFVVGKHEEENGIMELGELSNIHGSLIIKKLENVASSRQALKARIMDKTHIETLELRWSTGVDVTSSEIELDMLSKLQPHKGLQRLSIYDYRGTIFPDWLGYSSYHSMTRISLSSCYNCCRLPSIGQLPSLKSLTISRLNGLEKIGDEFYKSDDDHYCLAAPFPSLDYLEIEGMSCWDEWHSSQTNAFPQLKKLRIYGCPMLTGNIPDHLPALQTLEIDQCDEVKLQEMPHSVQSVTIGGCKVVKSMFQGITITHLTCLQSLSIQRCSCAISFPGDRIPLSLKTLEISDCRKLEFPRQLQQQHELLESLSIIKSCDSLTSFPLDTFPKLKTLTLRYCENLESLSVSQPHDDAALHRLDIFCCRNLVSFPREGLVAPSMWYFSIYKCDKLKSLPCHMNTLLPKLEHLQILYCPEIELFPDGGLPPNLKTIQIWDCEKLLSSLSSMGMHEGLTDLEIHGPCESVKSFPKEGSLPHLTSLKSLYLSRFSSLETLDCKELQHLTSLQELRIDSCRKRRNMTGERLPVSLTQLDIEGSPLLGERCKTKDPQIWPKISHIPAIRVNDLIAALGPSEFGLEITPLSQSTGMSSLLSLVWPIIDVLFFTIGMTFKLLQKLSLGPM